MIYNILAWSFAGGIAIIIVIVMSALPDEPIHL
jgi:hypothetical protein